MRISDWSSDVCSSDLHEAGLPIQLEERFVLASAAPDYGKMDFSQQTPNEYLVKIAPLERVDHTVRALMPDTKARDLLNMKEGEPALLLIRQTWSRSRLVSYARLIHPGSRFRSEEHTSELQSLMRIPYAR